MGVKNETTTKNVSQHGFVDLEKDLSDSESINSESSEEENAILELDQISILASSRQSLNRQRNSLKKPNHKKEIYHKSEEKLLNNVNNNNNNHKISTQINISPQKLPFKYKGICQTLLSAFFTSIILITLKKTYLFSASEQLVIRNATQMVVMIIINRYKKQTLLGPVKYRKILILRAFISTLSITCAYFSISFINPSDQSAIVQSSIVNTAILGRIFLNEKLAFVHLLAIGFTVTGVVFISQPSFLFPTNAATVNSTDLTSYLINNNCSFENQTKSCSILANNFNLRMSDLFNSNNLYLLGIVLVIFESIGRSLSQVILRKLCVKKVHYTITTLCTTFTGIPFSLALSAILIATGYSKIVQNVQTKSHELTQQFILLVITGLIGSMNQIVINLALKNEVVSKVSLVKTSELFFILILQSIFLDVHINTLNMIGVFMIFSSTIFILVFKYFDEKYMIDEHEKSKEALSGNNDEHRMDFIKQIVFFKF